MSNFHKTIDEIKNEEHTLWNEVKEFMDLLKEWGLGGGYALTGPVENPIITEWKITTCGEL